MAKLEQKQDYGYALKAVSFISRRLRQSEMSLQFFHGVALPLLNDLAKYPQMATFVNTSLDVIDATKIDTSGVQRPAMTSRAKNQMAYTPK